MKNILFTLPNFSTPAVSIDNFVREYFEEIYLGLGANYSEKEMEYVWAVFGKKKITIKYSSY